MAMDDSNFRHHTGLEEDACLQAKALNQGARVANLGQDKAFPIHGSRFSPVLWG